MFARHIAANFVTFLIIALIAVGGAIVWGKSEFQNEGPLASEVNFAVKSGDRLSTSGGRVGVADRLEQAGIIKNASVFRAAARYAKKDTQLKMGDYKIPAGASMAQVLDIVNSGVGISLNVTFPEGFTSFQIVERLKNIDGLTGEITSLPVEGSLAPNTYAYNPNASRQSILDKMAAAQTKILDAAWDNRAQGLPIKTKEEALIVASIIEKETPQKNELPVVSGVIKNRLVKGMPLGMDSTTVYEFTKGNPANMRSIRRSDLVKDTPYNTRKFKGLPPTPIGNPGKQAIEAALSPEATEFLYFVADGTGGHTFTKTLAEHRAATVKWRKIEAKRKADAAKANKN